MILANLAKLASRVFKGILPVKDAVEVRQPDPELFALAEEHFQRAKDAHAGLRPRLAMGHLQYALAYFDAVGDKEDALAALNNLAVEHKNARDYPLAISLLEQLVKVEKARGVSHGDLERYYRLLGEAHIPLGKYNAAIAFFEKARAIALQSGWDDEADKLEAELSVVQNLGMLRTRLRAMLASHRLPSAVDLAVPQTENDALVAEILPVDAVLRCAEAVVASRRTCDANLEFEALMSLAKMLRLEVGMNDESRTLFASAMKIATALRREDDEARALLGMGNADLGMGECRRARDALSRGLAIVGQGGDHLLALELTLSLAMALLRLDEESQSAEYLRLALERARLVVPTDKPLDALLSYGFDLRQLDFIDAAVACYSAAITLAESTDTKNDTYLALLHKLGGALALLHRPNAALSTLTTMIACAEELGEAESAAYGWIAASHIHLTLGNHDSLSDSVKKAAAIAQDLESPELYDELQELAQAIDQAEIQGLYRSLQLVDLDSVVAQGISSGFRLDENIAAVRARIERPELRTSKDELHLLCYALAGLLDQLGSTYEAGHWYRIALRATRAAGKMAVYGSILNDLGALFATCGRLHSARRAFRIALTCKDRYAGGKDHVSTEISLLRAELALGVLESTSQTEQTLMDLERNIRAGGERQRASALGQLSFLHFKTGSLAKARDLITEAIELLRKCEMRNEYLQSLTWAAQYSVAAADSKAVVEYGSRTLEEIESQASATTDSHLREFYDFAVPTVTHMLEAYRTGGIRNALPAISLAETVKARSLITHYGEDLLPPPGGMPENVKAEEASIMERLRAAKLLDVDASDDSQRASLVRQVKADARRHATEFWSSLEGEWQQYGCLRRGKAPDIDTLLAILRQRNSPVHLIVWYPSYDRTDVWYIDAGGTVRAWDTSSLTKDKLLSSVRSLLDAMSHQGQVESELALISRSLLEPYVDLIPAGETICVVPSGPLFQVPICALPCQGKYLIERNPVFALPSLTTLAYRSAQPARAGYAAPLVLGDSLGDLQNARSEARYVASAMGTRPIVGRNVERRTVAERVKTCDLLHIACHAVYDSTNPERSGFYLADGSIFSAVEFLSLRTRARIAVLSACESGVADIRNGDEMVGLSASLMFAGASAVIATLWKAPDRGTRDLMERFYDEVLTRGSDFAVALQRAQQACLSQASYAHPYYWAGFQLVGSQES